MTIPATALPSPGDLLDSLGTKGPTTGEPWRPGPGFLATLYARGMWAMAEGIRAALAARGKAGGTVWFPGYFCNEALGPLRAGGVGLRFYPLDIKKTLAPDWEALDTMAAAHGAPDVLVLVHYFGIPNDISGARAFCDTHGALLMEDAAHVLAPAAGIGLSELNIYSPRKLLAVPEGGVLIRRDGLPAPVAPQAGRHGGFARWVLKRLIQRCMRAARIPWHMLWGKGVQPDEAFSAVVAGPAPACTEQAKKLLAVQGEKFKNIARARRDNYIALMGALKGFSTGLRPLYAELPDSVCPYAFVLLSESGNSHIIDGLRARGVPASNWPDLPPEVRAEAGRFKAEHWLRDHIVLLPVHQGLGSRDINLMATALKDILERTPESTGS